MQIRQTRFMYSSPTDHESALDLWQCMCIIVKMAGWGKRGRSGGRSLWIYTDLFFSFFFFLRATISAEWAQLSCPQQSLPLGWVVGIQAHLHFHIGGCQHSFLAIKIGEDKRQAESTSWQIPCASILLILFNTFFPPIYWKVNDWH